MGGKPTRALRQPQTHKENNEAQSRADGKGKPPAQVCRQQTGIEKDDGSGRSQSGTKPETAVDRQIGPATHARRHQLLDGRIDGRIFAADAGTGQEAKEDKAPEIPGKGGGRGGQEIDGKRNKEQLLAAQPVRQPAEEDGAANRPGQIGTAGQPHVGVAELEHRALFERARQRTDQRDFQAVKDPGDAEGGNNQGLKASPRQAVEAGRDVRLNDAAGLGGRWRRLAIPVVPLSLHDHRG